MRTEFPQLVTQNLKLKTQNLKLYLTRRFYTALILVILLLDSGYLFTPFFVIGQWAFFTLFVLVPTDGYILYRTQGIQTPRQCSDRFSNGDDNEVSIRVEGTYSRPSSLEITDEISPIFQNRDICLRTTLQPSGRKTISYHPRPTRRGVYSYGQIRVFVTDKIGPLSRRHTCGQPQNIKVYPSYLMLHRYELLTMSDNLTELGIKRIRRVDRQAEFEQIREYVKGDDYRTINWKASARRHELMVNVYQDERFQQIYSVIDKGRVMQQAFRGMTLLDYAINALPVPLYVAIREEDKAGLVIFDEHFNTFVPTSEQSGHIQTPLEKLYSQQTAFGETDFLVLCVYLNKHVNKRSFLVLYTNFISTSNMNRQLAYLWQLNCQHHLLMVLLEDADLKVYIENPVRDTEDYYRHVIAEKFAFEKRLIVSILKQHGIYSPLMTPENLSTDAINKYLEMKSRQLL